MGQAELDNPVTAFDLAPEFPALIYNIRLISDEALLLEYARVRNHLITVERAVETLLAFYGDVAIPGLVLTRTSLGVSQERRIPYTTVSVRWRTRIPKAGVKSKDQKRAYCEFDDPAIQMLLETRSRDERGVYEHFEYRRQFLNLHLRCWWSVYDVLRDTVVDRDLSSPAVSHKEPLSTLDTSADDD